LQVGDNNKVLNDTAVSLVTACQKQLERDVAVMLLSVDEKKGAVVIVGNVPPSLVQKGLKANAWVNEAAVVVGKFFLFRGGRVQGNEKGGGRVALVTNVAPGGKGGGRPAGDVGAGRGTKVEAIQEAIAKGEEYARKF
jgi:hypothetical protein